MTSYVYRRKLTSKELLPALGVGVGLGAAAAYLAQILLRRAPLASGATRAEPRG